MWEVIFILLILKLPMVYVGWVVWWAVKAEPEIGAEGEPLSGYWKPWQHPSGSRPSRGGPHGAPARDSARATRRARKAAT